MAVHRDVRHALLDDQHPDNTKCAKLAQSIICRTSGDRLILINVLLDYGSRLISDATYPAPNPLSMFTTLTFEAHELSMPRSAAMPLNDAP